MAGVNTIVSGNSAPVVRYDDNFSENVKEVSIDKHGNKKYMDNAFERTSSLLAPIMQLTGHIGELYSCRFHPSGMSLVSSGHDLVWNTFGECQNIGVLRGHKGAVTEVCFSYDGERVITSSVDKTVGLWDYESFNRVRNFKGHTAYVNACAVSGRGMELAASASDDGTIRIWDLRSKQFVNLFDNHSANLSCCFNSFGDRVVSGGIDNDIKVWNLRADKSELVLKGHLDSITCVKLSKDGSYVISNSMDNSIRMWDIYPFCEGERCLKMFFGHSHNFEKNLLRCCFSPDSRFIASGSGDCCLYIWDSVTRTLLYKLPGHEGSVNDVDFHPEQPIIASCSSDKTIYIGELNL